jgi:hypothetical protein
MHVRRLRRKTSQQPTAESTSRPHQEAWISTVMQTTGRKMVCEAQKLLITICWSVDPTFAREHCHFACSSIEKHPLLHQNVWLGRRNFVASRLSFFSRALDGRHLG